MRSGVRGTGCNLVADVAVPYDTNMKRRVYIETTIPCIMLPTNPPSNGTRPIWFAAKRYGWGWGLPVAWQGWVVLAVWLGVVVAGASFLAGRHWGGFAIFMALMAALLVGICYAKGESPRWRWGK